MNAIPPSRLKRFGTLFSECRLVCVQETNIINENTKDKSLFITFNTFRCDSLVLIKEKT